MIEDCQLTKEQLYDKMCAAYKVSGFYRKRAEDLFNGHTDEVAREMADILRRSKEAEEAKAKLTGLYLDLTYERGPDGKFYITKAQ